MSISYPVEFFFIVFLFLPLSAAASSPQIPAQPPGYVVDLASILDASGKEQLNTVLMDLEQKTTVQMIILTINSLDGQDINSFSLQTAELWQLGQKGKDNGLLLVVALQDRKYRFEVGYGLEAVLPDSLVGSIGRKFLVPYFKQGQYAGGVTAATGAILEVLSSRYEMSFAGVDQLSSDSTQQQADRLSSFVFFLFVLVFVLFVYARSVNRKMREKEKYASGGSGMGPIIFPGRGWGGGSSGGFGGFSGGGGGFGGGGASGGW